MWTCKQCGHAQRTPETSGTAVMVGLIVLTTLFVLVAPIVLWIVVKWWAYWLR